jgi:hypothetical protein
LGRRDTRGMAAAIITTYLSGERVMSASFLKQAAVSVTGQELWGTVDFWAEESGLPAGVVRERLEIHDPRLIWVGHQHEKYLEDAFSESVFLESCADLLIVLARRGSEAVTVER